jgi:hypothetical protein
VEGSWEAQSYELTGLGPGEAAASARVTGERVRREERAHGGLAVSDWLTGDIRYEIRTGLDTWNGTRRAASVGGSLERRLLSDRLSVAADATTWMPLTAGSGFRAAGLHTMFRSSTDATGFVYLADGGVETVSAAAPLALWPGAGEGMARAPLLRAHPLLHDGVITGSMFGRQLAYANAELQWWVDRSLPVRIGFAAFADTAHARRHPSAVVDPWQVDLGAGLRVAVPGRAGTLRVDVGRGVRDGARALTIGWLF